VLDVVHRAADTWEKLTDRSARVAHDRGAARGMFYAFFVRARAKTAVVSRTGIEADLRAGGRMAEGRGDWRQEARRELLSLRGGRTAWGYRATGAAGVEPTVLACLGLIASGGASTPVAACCDWLAALQGPDGSLGLSPAQPAPGWTTPLGLLLWQAEGLGRHATEARRAVAWLLRQRGERMSPADDPDHIIGHDTTLVGWPWVAGTHSWLEPTAVAVLALRRAGLTTHPRVEEGYRLIRDRAIVTGGWNYGNTAAFGHPLRPQPAPTGLALLALAHHDERTPIVARAIQYLHETLPDVRASASLGWGLLGLRAWSSAPAEADRWLAEAYRRATGRPDAATKLSLLLLAGGDHALELFA
jgi:hypothetical protein